MYKLKHHKTLAARWHNFPRSQQILMIANELNRAKNMMKKRDQKEVINACERAFELIDLTIDTTRALLMRKELLRYRDVLAQIYISNNNDAKLMAKLIRVLASLDKDSYNLLYNIK
jgi:hypothetical protein